MQHILFAKHLERRAHSKPVCYALLCLLSVLYSLSFMASDILIWFTQTKLLIMQMHWQCAVRHHSTSRKLAHWWILRWDILGSAFADGSMNLLAAEHLHLQTSERDGALCILHDFKSWGHVVLLVSGCCHKNYHSLGFNHWNLFSHSFGHQTSETKAIPSAEAWRRDCANPFPALAGLGHALTCGSSLFLQGHLHPLHFQSSVLSAQTRCYKDSSLDDPGQTLPSAVLPLPKS